MFSKYGSQMSEMEEGEEQGTISLADLKDNLMQVHKHKGERESAWLYISIFFATSKWDMDNDTVWGTEIEVAGRGDGMPEEFIWIHLEVEMVECSS